MSDRKHWWASAPHGLSRRAKAGTGAVAASLLLVTVAVWTSPTTARTTAEEILAAEPQVTSEEDLLRAEVAALRKQLAAAEDAARASEDGDADDGTDGVGTDGPAQADGPSADRPSRNAERAPRRDGSTGSRDGGRATGSRGSGTSPGTAAPTSPSRPGGGSTGGSDGPANPSNPRPPAPPVPPRPEPVTAPPVEALLQPEHRYYGMYTAQAPFSWATFDEAAAKTGRLPDVVGYFQGWDKPFRADAVTRAWQRGMLPVMTWESRPSSAANDQVNEPDYNLHRIAGDPENGVPGAFDDYLRQYARDVAATGLPVAIRLNHEMNGVWYPWSEVDGQGRSINGNREGDFVRMWQHVHDIFEAEGANEHVIWVWAPNIVNNLPARLKQLDDLERLYPGDEYVDWVGLSGYYRPPYKVDQTPTFDYTFGESLRQLRQLTDKPILLSEVGASEVGGKKPQWVADFFDGLTRPENSDVIGFVWFNLAITTYVQGERLTNDWRVDSRRDSLEAFGRGVNDPRTRLGGTVVDRAVVDGFLETDEEVRAAQEPEPTASPTASPSPSPSPTPTPTPTPSPTASPTPTPTPTPMPDDVPAPPADESSDESTATAAPSPSPTGAPAP